MSIYLFYNVSGRCRDFVSASLKFTRYKYYFTKINLMLSIKINILPFWTFKFKVSIPQAKHTDRHSMASMKIIKIEKNIPALERELVVMFRKQRDWFLNKVAICQDRLSAAILADSTAQLFRLRYTICLSLYLL